MEKLNLTENQKENASLENRKPKMGLIPKIAILLAIFIICFLGYRIYGFVQYMRNNPRVRQAGEIEFNQANKDIIRSKNGVYQGNTPTAMQAAEKFSEIMKRQREKNFTEGDKSAFSISGGEFITYCNLQESTCVFLIHIPQLRKFTSSAKTALNSMAWDAAWLTAKELKLDKKELAVGVKGAILYSAIYIGDFDLSKETPGEIKEKGDGISDTRLLYRFFTSLKNENPQNQSAPAMTIKKE